MILAFSRTEALYSAEVLLLWWVALTPLQPFQRHGMCSGHRVSEGTSRHLSRTHQNGQGVKVKRWPATSHSLCSNADPKWQCKASGSAKSRLIQIVPSCILWTLGWSARPSPNWQECLKLLCRCWTVVNVVPRHCC